MNLIKGNLYEFESGKHGIYLGNYSMPYVRMCKSKDNFEIGSQKDFDLWFRLNKKEFEKLYTKPITLRELQLMVKNPLNTKNAFLKLLEGKNGILKDRILNELLGNDVEILAQLFEETVHYYDSKPSRTILTTLKRNSENVIAKKDLGSILVEEDKGKYIEFFKPFKILDMQIETESFKIFKRILKEFRRNYSYGTPKNEQPTLEEEYAYLKETLGNLDLAVMSTQIHVKNKSHPYNFYKSISIEDLRLNLAKGYIRETNSLVLIEADDMFNKFKETFPNLFDKYTKQFLYKINSNIN